MNQTPSEFRTDGDVVRRRTVAYAVDAVVLGGTITIAVKRFTQSRIRRTILTVISNLLVGLLYHILLEGTYGQTLGKKLLGIVVVREDGEQCTYTAATIRTVLRFVDWLPVAYLIGFASISLTERHQRLGDLLAGTVVVSRNGRRNENRN